MGKYKHFVKHKKEREETTTKKGNGVELQQTTLESIVRETQELKCRSS